MDLTLISLFCVIDDFCQELLPQWNAILLEDTNKKRNKPSQMSTSEIMTIMIYFHKSNYRNFKMYYLHVIKGSMVNTFQTALATTDSLNSCRASYCLCVFHCGPR
ncbi:hypothetical protein [Piscirickettsia salmonis]|uniref:hypothetical protein n=1 Tax=Piscirickettsia salmonis TaxID=1238 RepID=UPI003B75B5B5